MALFRPAQTQRHRLLPLALFAAYATTATLSYAMTTGAGGLAVLWINNGLLAASLLLLQRKSGILLAGACTLTDFLGATISGAPPTQAMLIASCDLAESIAAAILMRRVGGAALDIIDLKRFRAIALSAVLPATLTIGTIGAVVSAIAFGQDFLPLLVTWAGGDFLGMMIGAPAILLLARFGRYDGIAAARLLERVVLLAGAVVTAWLIFFVSPAPVLYLVFPVGLMLVIRLSPPYSLLGVLIFSFIAAAATVLGHGPIAGAELDISMRILLLQLYLASLLFSGLVLVSVLSQRARAQNRLRRALSTARRMREVADQAAGAKGRFLAVMSHEMRTPLNGIAGYAQLLGARNDLPRDALDQVRTIESSSGVLLALISDVLDYSRTESGQLHLIERPFHISDVIDRSFRIVQPMLNGRPIDLKVCTDIDKTLAHQGDERRCTQILLNLLGNAVKFTEQGSITVSVEVRPTGDADADEITIRVRDTGIGIAADKLNLLFNPFTQVDVSDTRSFAGAGLGLAISQSLIQRMGGDIGVVSRVGEGSEFWFTLTLPRAPADDDARIDSEIDLDSRAARVLVVDDHAVNRQVAALMLEAAGFEVATAENGALAVDLVRTGRFDLVLMDLHMPVMDGLSACRAIRALDGPISKTPVIAMTAAAMPEDVDRCLAAGMTDHIAKPIRQEELFMKTIRQLTPRDIVNAA